MAFERNFLDCTGDLAGLSVEQGEFAAVGASLSERSLFEPLVALLHRVRHGVGLDVLFVAPVFGEAPFVRPAAEFPGVDPDEMLYATAFWHSRPGRTAQRVDMDPLGAPVVSKDGRRFGAVFCRTRVTRTGADAAPVLRSVARVVALALSRGDLPDPRGVWDSSAAAPLGLS